MVYTKFKKVIHQIQISQLEQLIVSVIILISAISNYVESKKFGKITQIYHLR